MMLVFLYECGFLKGDINFLYKDFKNVLLELNKEYMDHNKNQEESILKRFQISKRKFTSILFLKMLDMYVR